MKRNIGLEVLLELHGTEYTEDNGYWYRIEAWIIDPTPQRPHGIRYNLTLHDEYNKRILGFDNAHAVKKKTDIQAVLRNTTIHTKLHWIKAPSMNS